MHTYQFITALFYILRTVLQYFVSVHLYYVILIMMDQIWLTSPLHPSCHCSMDWVLCYQLPRHQLAYPKQGMSMIFIGASQASRSSVKVKEISFCSGEYMVCYCFRRVLAPSVLQLSLQMLGLFSCHTWDVFVWMLGERHFCVIESKSDEALDIQTDEWVCWVICYLIYIN